MKQATSHPFTAEKIYRHYFTEHQISAVIENLIRASSSPLTTQLRTGKKYDTGLFKYTWGLDYLAGLGDSTVKGDFDICPFLKLAENERRVAELSCPECDTTPPKKPIQARDVSS